MNPTRALDRIFATSAFAVLGFLAFLEVSVAANVRVSAAPVAPAAGHRPLVLEATFEQADCALVSKESYTLVYLAGAELPEGTPGDPWLPAKCVGVLIPPETSVRILRVEANEILVAHNVLVYPAQPPVPLSEPRPPFKGPNPASYARKSLVPTEVAEITGHHTLRGYRYATVRLNPVRYIPTTGELYLATEVRVTLLPLSEPRAYVRPARNLHLFRQMVTRLTVNGEMAEGFSGEDSEAITEPVSETTSAVDYLIITSSALAGSFQALANYRAGRNGVTTQVVTVENIYTNPGYAGSDNPTRIRNCIRDYVRNRGTAFVVFGGDNTVVPVRGCYVSCGSYTETAMPTDLYYAGLDSTWDEDGDGVYGEADTAVGDEGDLGPDVIVARIPVRSTAQADAYIGKVVNFEANAVASLKQKAFLGGLKLWDSYSGADRPSDVLNDGHLQFQQHSPVSDGEMWVRRLYRDGIQPWWSVPTLRLFFDTLTSWDSSTAGDYVLNAANLSTRFNEGWFHVYFATHGSTTSWSLESGSYGTANASGLSGLTVFVYTIACLTRGFDSAEPSLSEAFLRNGLGGAIAYFGCSRYGWGSPDSPPASNYSRGGTSMEYGYEFYKQLLTSGQTVMGAVFSLHKAARAGWCGYNGSDRWVQFGLNYQGDPLIDLGEVVTSPTALLGQDTTWVGKLESYTATGAISSDGHPLQYRFDWGNGVTSAWGSATQVCVWEQAGTYNIRAQARCATHPSVQSSWSGVLKTVSVSYCEISGFVRDTDGRGISNVAMNGFLPPTYTAATGFYRGLVPWSWCGTVVPTKAGYVFQPDSRTYTNLAGNKSSEDYVGALMAPAGVTATDGTLTDRVRVTWSAAEGATHYQIYRAASAGGTKIALSGWIPGTSYDDTTAMAGERYWYSVRAAAGTNGESASAYSAEDEGYVASAPCDLVISSISASSSGGAGQAVTVTVATKNQSAVNPAPGSTTRVYFSVDGVLDGGDVGIGECRVPMLGPGGVFTTGVVARLPVGAADGTWYLIAVADADGEVSETVEANNTKSRTIKLGPDLTVTVLT
ncbi:MAG: C25 family cysteine peptidase, partial [Kiritimatiellae bacterium]|nr:C25 family cysteine peptidase [Kiritimatiellia bacterium]